MLNKKVVPVFDKYGVVVARVAQNATSVAATKITGETMEFSRRYGVWGWVCKIDYYQKKGINQ